MCKVCDDLIKDHATLLGIIEAGMRYQPLKESPLTPYGVMEKAEKSTDIYNVRMPFDYSPYNPKPRIYCEAPLEKCYWCETPRIYTEACKQCGRP